jgi:hypothetical protein
MEFLKAEVLRNGSTLFVFFFLNDDGNLDVI